MLGGEVRGNHVYAPGPGHSANDRSLSVLLDASAPDGFVIHSFAGDDADRMPGLRSRQVGLAGVRAKKKKANGKGTASGRR